MGGEGDGVTEVAGLGEVLTDGGYDEASPQSAVHSSASLSHARPTHFAAQHLLQTSATGSCPANFWCILVVGGGRRRLVFLDLQVRERVDARLFRNFAEPFSSAMPAVRKLNKRRELEGEAQVGRAAGW